MNRLWSIRSAMAVIPPNLSSVRPLRRRAFRAIIISLSLVMFSAAIARAQIEQGRLTGLVRDAQGGVLPGVTVTATSPALIESQTTVSGTNGRYQFPALPPGTYTLAFGLAGFQTFRQNGINLTVGTTLTINARLQLASVKENVTVSGAAPVVDISTTKVGTTLTAARDRIGPLVDRHLGVIAQAQGVRMANFDVGGSAKALSPGSNSFGQGQRANLHRRRGNDQRQLSRCLRRRRDGGQRRGRRRRGDQPGPVGHADGQERRQHVPRPREHHLRAGQLRRQQRRRGDGGEGLHGPAEPPVLGAAQRRGRLPQAEPAVVLHGVQPLHHSLGDFGRSAGRGDEPRHLQRQHDEDDVPRHEEGHAGSATTSTARRTPPTRGLSATTSPESLLGQFAPSFTNKGEWQRVWNNSLFTDVFYSNGGYYWPMQPLVDAATHPPVEDLETGQISGAGWNAFVAHRTRPNIVAKATYYLPTKHYGSHRSQVRLHVQTI